MKTVKLSDTNVIQQIRNNMPVADSGSKGLLSSTLYNTISYTKIINGSTLYKILTVNGAWNRQGFLITIASEGGGWVKCINCSTITSGNVFTQTTRKKKNVMDLKIYKKDNSLYIYGTWSKDTIYPAFINSSNPIVPAGNLDDTYEELPTIDW